MQLSYQDQEHLRLLSVFHYVQAILIALLACIPLIYVVIGMVVALGTLGSEKSAAPQFIGLIFVIIGVVVALIGWAIAAMVGMAGKFLSQRRHYTYCLVIAGLNCMHAPLGTILGVFTFVVLLRPEVKVAFEGQSPQAPLSPTPQPNQPAA